MRRLWPLLLLLAACKHRSSEPPTVEWTSDHEFHLAGEPEKKGDVAIFDGHYQVTLYKFPRGVEWRAGARSGHLDSDIYSIIKVADVVEKMGAAPANGYRDTKIDPQTKLRLTLPDAGMLTVDLPALDFGFQVGSLMEKIDNGPVLFGSEAAHRVDRPASLLAVEGPGSVKLFGRATLLRDVDAVSRTRTLPEVKGTKVCSGYKKDGKPVEDLTLRLKETEVTIYDRRTGAPLEKKVFPPDDHCPMFAFHAAGEGQDSYAPTEAIETWLRTRVY
jgi:hypothetical protein